jgi:hypothetical protein
VVLAASLAGCVVSQPIVVTYPSGATWTFVYHDAMGQEVGGGKAEVAFEGQAMRVTFTEKAFGDVARFAGELGPAGADGWASFSGQGKWFDGQVFVYAGCIHRQQGRVAPGALAMKPPLDPALPRHPLRIAPCAGAAGRAARAPAFGEALVDRVFSWSAGVSRRK